MDDPILRRAGLERRPPFRKRSGASLLTRAKTTVPQVRQCRVARLNCREAEALAGVLNDRAIVLPDSAGDAGPCLERRFRQESREVLVVLGLQPLELTLESGEIAIEISGRHD